MLITFFPRQQFSGQRIVRMQWASMTIAALMMLCFSTQLVMAQTTDSPGLLASWLNAQTNVQTWSADFTQIRSLKALTQPLTASGHVWFAAPNQFHWEITNPAPTIAIRQADQLWVISPRLKHAEVYSLSSAAAGPMKDTLALLDAGFPRSRAEVESKFNILGQSTSNDIHEVTLQPKAEMARKFMPQIKIAFDTKTLLLHSTELQFTDGSSMLNVFTNAVLNPPIDASVFQPMTNGLKIVEPFKNSSR